MTWQVVIGLGGLVTGTLVGGSGVVSGYLTARTARRDARALAEAEREHTRRLANDERVFSGRSTTYLETLRHLHRRWAFIERTHPVAPAREPPPPPSDEDLLEVEALLGAFGSAPVRRAVYDFGTCAARFKQAAGQYDGFLAQEGAEQQRTILRETVNHHRHEAWVKLREIEALIQRELTGEEAPEAEPE
jgi:hypothetical protein